MKGIHDHGAKNPIHAVSRILFIFFTSWRLQGVLRLHMILEG